VVVFEAAVSETAASVVLFVIEETVVLDGDREYVGFVDAVVFAPSVVEVVDAVSLVNTVLVFAGRVALAVICGVLLVAWLIVMLTV